MNEDKILKFPEPKPVTPKVIVNPEKRFPPTLDRNKTTLMMATEINWGWKQ